jgi:hypothetical protein
MFILPQGLQHLYRLFDGLSGAAHLALRLQQRLNEGR